MTFSAGELCCPSEACVMLDTMQKKAQEYRTLVEDWLFAAGCVSVGICGCFCQRGNATSSIRSGTGGVIVYSLVFRGTYKQLGSTSDSLSASV